MDTTQLQHKLKHLTYLLPSQREILERLLFQLAFNQLRCINLIGSTGSGKSTLALALAELFSEQFNVGLLSTDVSEEAATAQLSQQWFSGANKQSFEEQIEHYNGELPLLLIIDDIERFSLTLQQRLMALPSLVITCSSQVDSSAALNLTIGRITQADAQQLLRAEKPTVMQLTERLATADGNLHVLLQPLSFAQALSEQNAVTAHSGGSKARQRTLALSGAVVAVLAITAVLTWWLWTEQRTENNRAEPAVNYNPDSSSETSEAINVDKDLAVIFPASPAPVDNATADTLSESALPVVVSETDLSQNQADELALSEAPQTEEENKLTSPGVAVSTTEQDNKQQVDDTTPQSTEQVTERDIAELGIEKPDTSGVKSLHQEAELLSLDRDLMALQLAVLSSERALSQFRQRYSQLTILSYQRRWQGKEQIVALLAPFATTDEAKQQLQVLPDTLQKTGPFVKTMQSAQAEIKAYQRMTNQPMTQATPKNEVN